MSWMMTVGVQLRGTEGTKEMKEEEVQISIVFWPGCRRDRSLALQRQHLFSGHSGGHPRAAGLVLMAVWLEIMEVGGEVCNGGGDREGAEDDAECSGMMVV